MSPAMFSSPTTLTWAGAGPGGGAGVAVTAQIRLVTGEQVGLPCPAWSRLPAIAGASQEPRPWGGRRVCTSRQGRAQARALGPGQREGGESPRIRSRFWQNRCKPLSAEPFPFPDTHSRAPNTTPTQAPASRPWGSCLQLPCPPTRSPGDLAPGEAQFHAEPGSLAEPFAGAHGRPVCSEGTERSCSSAGSFLFRAHALPCGFTARRPSLPQAL